MRTEIYRRLLGAFSWERTVCRVVAAWCCLILTTLKPTSDFIHLSFAQGTSLLQVALGVLLFFALLSVAAFFGTPVNTDAIALLISSTVCFLWWGCFYSGEAKGLFLLSSIAVYSLFVIYCVRALMPLLELWKPGKRTRLGALIFAGVICCTVIATFGCLRYRTFSTPNFDFGIFCNMFHNMRETGLPMVTCERDQLLSHFVVHISPAYYLFLPFYFTFPSPLTLQICQAVVLAAGVIPVYLLARHFQLSSKVTILLTLAYAFYPAISAGCFYDLHENCFLPLFLLLTFYFFETKRTVPMYVCAALVLTVKEDAAVYLLFFAIFVLLSERKYLHGAILAGMAVGYFLLCGFLLEKYGTGMMVNRFDNLIYNDEDGLLGAIKTALVNPAYLLTQLFSAENKSWDKIIYFVQMLLPLGLLPFCTKKASRWLLVAPILINMLTMYGYQYNVGFQYHFGITAFLFYATLKNLPEIEAASVRRTLLSIAAAACVCCYAITVLPFVNSYTGKWIRSRDSYLEMETFLQEELPEDASVAASTFLLPHISDRSEIYEVAYHGYASDVEFVVLDLRYDSHKPFLNVYSVLDYEEYARLDNRILILQKSAE